MVDWSEHIAAGETTDLPGHCKWCGKEIEGEPSLMHDPSGAGEPHEFCSDRCLRTAESILDGLDDEAKSTLERLVTEQVSHNEVKH